MLPDPSPAVGRSRLPAAPELAPPGSLRARLVAAAGLPAAVAGTTPPLARTLLALLAALQVCIWFAGIGCDVCRCVQQCVQVLVRGLARSPCVSVSCPGN